MRELLQSRGNKIAAGVLALVAIALAFANPLWIPIILILGGLGIVTVAWVKAVRRSRESFFSAYANQRGLSMKLDDTPDRRLNGTPLLRMGEDSWVEHLMTGALDDQTQGLLGHWTYTTSYRDADGNEQTSYHSFTVAMTEVPEARERLPFFLAHRREGIRMFDKAEDAVLGRDVKRIEFESDALDRRYEIFAPPEQDQSFVRQLFSPKFIVWMSEEAPKKFAFEYEDGVLCCSVDRELDSAEELDALRAATAGVARRLRAIQDVVVKAEGDALKEDDLVVRNHAEVHALASPLRRLGDPPENVGVMTVARKGAEFTQGERDVFLYLVGQVASSIENIALHELVSEQAVTDELTGLSNQRRFRELIAKEDERARRFRHDLSLVMLDIDDFKLVNDTRGHLQGDEVLRMVGRVLREESRGVDEPARYGGEEFAVALPETSLSGAAEVAERVRSRIESESVPGIDGQAPLTVTASIGAASMPASAENARDLIAAADAALYGAKRAGKNRVVTAPARSPAGRA